MDFAGAFQDWLRSVPAFEGAVVGDVLPVEGGVSNLTYRVTLAGAPYAAVALRFQRERGIFEPYDVLREAEVVRRLAQSDVPVPAVVATEADAAVLGTPFAVFEWIDAPHMGEAGADASFAAYTSMVARIHRLDWRALELDFLGVPASAGDAVRGELALVAARMKRFPGADDPLLQQAVAILREQVPEDGRLSLCQGDINVFNYLFRRREVAGVVDWEQARIGDPRSDIGQLTALSHLRGAPFVPPRDLPFVQAYEMATMEPLAGLEFFRAFWLFQLGVIYHGWMAYSGSEPWYPWDAVVVLLEDALAELT